MLSQYVCCLCHAIVHVDDVCFNKCARDLHGAIYVCHDLCLELIMNWANNPTISIVKTLYDAA